METFIIMYLKDNKFNCLFITFSEALTTISASKDKKCQIGICIEPKDLSKIISGHENKNYSIIYANNGETIVEKSFLSFNEFIVELQKCVEINECN